MPQEQSVAAVPGGLAGPGRSGLGARLSLARKPRRAEAAVELGMRSAAILSALFILLVAFYVLSRGVPALLHNGWGFVANGGWDAHLEDAWASPEGATFGARGLVWGTTLSTLAALAVTVIIGTGAAVVISELAPPLVRRPLEAVVQLLAGIPSVVFGLVGFSLIVPLIGERLVPESAFEEVPTIPFDGQSLLAAVIVLVFMIAPFYVSVATDSLRAVPRPLIDGGRALGLTRWRAIRTIQIPVAFPGLVAGAMLAAARAIGEAIALSMVAGALALTPSLRNGPLYFVLTPVRTMASAIVETGGEAMSIPSVAGALFALASLLLLASLTLSIAARAAFAASTRKVHQSQGRAA